MNDGENKSPVAQSGKVDNGEQSSRFLSDPDAELDFVVVGATARVHFVGEETPSRLSAKVEEFIFAPSVVCLALGEVGADVKGDENPLRWPFPLIDVGLDDIGLGNKSQGIRVKGQLSSDLAE